MICSAFWRHLVDLGAILDPIGFGMGVSKSTVSEKHSQEIRKKEVQETALEKHDLLIDF